MQSVANFTQKYHKRACKLYMYRIFYPQRENTEETWEYFGIYDKTNEHKTKE
jgi:hypothetical protein